MRESWKKAERERASWRLERWNLRAQDKFEPNEWTQTDYPSSWRSQDHHRIFSNSTWCWRPCLVRILRASYPPKTRGHGDVTPLGLLRPQTLIILIQGEGAAPRWKDVRLLLILIFWTRISRPWLIKWIFNDRKQTSLSTITLIVNLKQTVNQIVKTKFVKLTLWLW